MAKISLLDSATVAATSSELPLNVSNVTKKVSLQLVLETINPYLNHNTLSSVDGDGTYHITSTIHDIVGKLSEDGGKISFSGSTLSTEAFVNSSVVNMATTGYVNTTLSNAIANITYPSVATFSSATFGTSVSNTTFETDGTMKMNGDATVWVDVCTYQFSPLFPSNVTIVETVASLLTTSTGTPSGTLSDTYVFDGERFSVTETSQGLSTEFSFYNLTKECDYIYIDGYFTKGSIKQLDVFAYNFVTATYVSLGRFSSTDETSVDNKVFKLTGTISDYYNSTGVSRVKLERLASGGVFQAGHVLVIEKITIARKSYNPKSAYFGNTGIRCLSFDGTGPSQPIKYSGAFEIQHSYKESSTIYPHIHIANTSTVSGTISFMLEYEWYNRTGDVRKYGSITFSHVNSTTSTIGIPIVVGNSPINGNGMAMGSRFRFSLSRTPNGNGDTYPDPVLFEDLGLHVELDTLGSRTMLTK